MSFVSLNSSGWLYGKDGMPFYPVGINYVAPYICTNFWEDFRPEVLKKDLEYIADLGLNAVRIPMFWGYMEPREREYNEDIFPKFDLFLSWCRELDIYVMPWFLVGVATRDYDVPFRARRPFFTGDMVEIARDHIRHFVQRYRNEEQILMWDLCDEPEYYCRHPGAEQWPFDRQSLKQWVQVLYDGVKDADPNHLITLGFGHIASANFGYHVLDMAQILDLMVVTCYPLGIGPEAPDTMRNTFFLPFYIAFNRPSQNAVLTCEAPGFSSIMFSEAVIGRYFRACLYANLAEGSIGVMPWAFNDFASDIWHECPLEEYVFEPRFGVVANDGRLKPSGEELMRFARYIKALNITAYNRSPSRVAVIVPRDYYDNIDTAFPHVYLAYMMLRTSGVQTDLVWQGHSLEKYDLVVVVDTAGFTTSWWGELSVYVHDGGMLAYMFDKPTGLCAYTNELFGVIVEAPLMDFGQTKVQVCGAWNGKKKKEWLPIGAGQRGIRLDVTAHKARVSLSFEDGLPFYVTNDYGKGKAVLITSPLLDGVLRIAPSEFENHLAWQVFGQIIHDSKTVFPLQYSGHDLSVAYFEHVEENRSLCLLTNHSNRRVSCNILLPQETEKAWILSEEGSWEQITSFVERELDFEPCETRTLCLHRTVRTS